MSASSSALEVRIAQERMEPAKVHITYIEAVDGVEEAVTSRASSSAWRLRYKITRGSIKLAKVHAGHSRR